MEKGTNNPLVGFLLGLAVTAVIQSSTATIVLTSGLVGAGVLTLHQSIGIILGANVGTTITGQIIRLLDLNADGGAWLNLFKPCTGRALLQAVAHELHTVEKQCQPAEERNKVKNRHTVTNLLCVPDPYFTVPVAEMAYCAKLHQILW